MYENDRERGGLVINGFWIFIKCVFCIYWYDHVVFILHFVDVVDPIYWLVNVVLTLHSWNKSQLIMMYEFWMHYCIWFANILLRILASMFFRDGGPSFSFFIVSLSGFGRAWEPSLFLNIWNSYRRRSVSFFQNAW